MLILTFWYNLTWTKKEQNKALLQFMSKRRKFQQLCTTAHIFSNYLSHKYRPAKLLDGADINDSVVEVVHKLWHVLVQEPLVCMHRVTCRKRNHRTWLQNQNRLSSITVLLLVLLTSKGTLSRWGLLSDKGQKLILCLFQGDFTVPYSLGQPWLRHNYTCYTHFLTLLIDTFSYTLLEINSLPHWKCTYYLSS